MKIALIADIHGNSLALKQVLDKIKRQGINELIIAGDRVISNPHRSAIASHIWAVRYTKLVTDEEVIRKVKKHLVELELKGISYDF